MMEPPYRVFRRFAALSFLPLGTSRSIRRTMYLNSPEMDRLRERASQEGYNKEGVFHEVMLNDFKEIELGFHNDHGQRYLAMLTIGASADFGIRPRRGGDPEFWTLVEHGDLVVMNYEADWEWNHSVWNHGHRQSLIFREFRT